MAKSLPLRHSYVSTPSAHQSTHLLWVWGKSITSLGDTPDFDGKLIHNSIYIHLQHKPSFCHICRTWSSETAKCAKPQTLRIHRGFCWCHVVRCSDLVAESTRLNKLLQVPKSSTTDLPMSWKSFSEQREVLTSVLVLLRTNRAKPMSHTFPRRIRCHLQSVAC